MTFTLPDLPYAHDALAPHMSQETLEFHHDKHHNAYVVNGNKLLSGSGLEGQSLEDIVRGSYGKPALAGLFNNAAQHWNHNAFWQMMTANGGGEPAGDIGAQIVRDFGSYGDFREAFIQAGLTQFGSGWCWLVLDNGKLSVTKTPNGENPLVHDQVPLLGCDVWEHSYYIDFRNARPDYLACFLDNLVNWDEVAKRLTQA